MATTTMIFSSMLVITFLLSCCSATVYKVEDSEGWTTKQDRYNDWAKRKKFHVGISLVFEYSREFDDDVTQVYGALEYLFCDSSSAKAIYNTDNDTVTLTEPGYHYFITSNHIQCSLGQKLEVLVLLPNPTASPSTPTRKILPRGKIYKVGDYRGWGVYYDTQYYYNWGKDKEFLVGDSLFFQYGKASNDDVFEVHGEVAFITCDPTSLVAVHKTGRDLVRLTKPGVHYFISSNIGHCENGLKLQVVVRERPGPEPVRVSPNVPRHNMGLSPLGRFRNRWFHTFRPRRPHHK